MFPKLPLGSCEIFTKLNPIAFIVGVSANSILKIEFAVSAALYLALAGSYEVFITL